MTCTLLFFSSCEKERLQTIEKSSPQISTNNVDATSSSQVLGVIRDCCDCTLHVLSTDANTSDPINNTWITQVIFEGCNNNQTILQVGGQVNAPNPNVYDTPGQVKTFKFKTHKPGDTTGELRTLVGAFYNNYPIEIKTWVTCNSTFPGNIVPELELNCTGITNPGCGSGGPVSQSFDIKNCAATNGSSNGM